MRHITTLFLDIGGVLLTNGWDNGDRRKVSAHFGLDWDAFEQRHQKLHTPLETGQITLDEYLKETVFYEPRPFTEAEFIEQMRAVSQSFEDMIEFICAFKKEHGLKVVALSNESRELSDYRTRTFDLKRMFDAFFVSGYVYYQKPDAHIYEIALDVMQVEKSEVVYIDDRAALIEAGEAVGLLSIMHTSLESTRHQLTALMNAQT